MSTLLILATASSLAVSRLADEQAVAAARAAELPAGTERYIVAHDDEESLKAVPGSVLLAAYNATKSKPIKGFHDRTKAMTQGWMALNVLAGKNGEPVPVTAPVAPTQEGEPMATATKGRRKSAAKKSAKKAAGKPATKGTPRAHRLIEMEPTAKNKDAVLAARAGSKTATMIDLLAEGATLAQIGTALSEKGRPINARAWVTGFHRFGYGVKAVDPKAENPTYRLVYPTGMRQPLAHKVAGKSNGAGE